MNINENTITLIGGGASALSFIHKFLQKHPRNAKTTTTIYVVEKRAEYGSGAAYHSDYSSNIMNTKTGYITVHPELPGDFSNWLNKNTELWQDKFPDYNIDNDGYAPRPLFGLYLQSSFSEEIRSAIAKNVRVVQVNAEATDVSKINSSYVTKTNCNLDITSDFVFLLCGTLPRIKKDSPKQPGAIISNPYPINKLAANINPTEDVAIIGSRLSAIDTIIGLVENGHKGKIRMYSRSGYFPSVRGTQGRITPAFLSPSYLSTLISNIHTVRINDVIDLVRMEIDTYFANNPSHHREALVIPPPPISDFAEFLKKEIELAKKPRGWQAVLYSTNVVIDQIWHALHDDDKERFLSEFSAPYFSYRVSIPRENAEKILSYVEQGKLEFITGNTTITKNEDGSPVIYLAKNGINSATDYGYVIYATGSPKSPQQSDSVLLNNLINKGSVTMHPHGGLNVTPDTYKIISRTGDTQNGMYALGEITAGTFLFTSALDIIARHAGNCADVFYDEHFLEQVPSIGTEQISISSAV